MKSAPAYNDLPPDLIAAALSHIDASSRELWVEMAMAVKSELGEAGFDIWNDWSASAPNYSKAAARDVWKSVKGGGGITIGTLIHYAQEGGFELENVTTKRLSADEVRARQEARAEEQRIADEQKRARQAAVAKEATRIWEAAHDAETHPYLERKGVRSYGLRIGDWPTGSQALLIPLMDATGAISSLQAIFANPNPTIGRDKDFLAGGKKRGSFYTIGMPPPAGQGTIVICEGYATGATIHEATGLFVVVGFDAGNLKSVAYEMRRRYPAAQMVIAADNDRWTTVPVENPGLTAAREIAELLPSRVQVAVPEFKNLDDKPTDFNDLARLEGIEAVRAAITALLPAIEPANDNAANVPMHAVVPPFGFPYVSEKGQPLNTVENLAYLMGEYGITAKYNIIRKSVEVHLPERAYSADNRANAALAELNSMCARNRMPVSMLSDYVKLLADANAYNPVCDWISSKPWDGVSRLQQLFDTVKVDGNTELRDLLLHRWLLSAVAAVYMERGFESHGVLVFTGKQGDGKTKWIKRLVPDDLHDLVLVGAVLDPNNKDTVTNAVSHWLVELGELDATFRKADIARLKSFVTNSVDKVRRPYDRIESEYQRRTVFFASVNEDRYLVDDTGNRRWWTVPVVGVNYEHSIDMQQLWAEVLVQHRSGERHYLDRAEQQRLNEANSDHEAVDPVEEQIVRMFDWQQTELVATQEMTATEVLIAIGYDRPNKAQSTHASKVLKKLTGREPSKKYNGRFFTLPKLLKSNNQYAENDDSQRPF